MNSLRICTTIPSLVLRGEIISDELSWLMHPIVIEYEPKEQVDNPTDVASKAAISPPPQIMPVLSDVSREITEQKVTPEPECDDTNDISTVETPCRYELPPKSTRGIPPKRYDLEYEAQRSRHPLDQGNT